MKTSQTRPRSGRMLAFAIALMVASVAACGPTTQKPDGAVDAPSGMPTPRSAVPDIGGGAGVDSGRPYYGYTSALPPKQARATYEADLIAAGFAKQPRQDGWTPFTRGTTILMVKVGDAGPPTSIIVQVATAGTSSGPTTGPVPSSGAKGLGEPEPPTGTSVLTTRPDPTPTHGNGTGNGNNGNGNGNGNGQGNNGNGNGNNGNGQGNNGNGNNGNGNGNGNNGNNGNGNPNPGATPVPKPEKTQKPEKTHKPKPQQDAGG